MKTKLTLVGHLSTNWAIHQDGIQWILSELKYNRWKHHSFITSTKAILERCIKDKGAIVDSDGIKLLSGLENNYKRINK